MTATTCTLTRQGQVTDLAGPWGDLLDEPTLDALLRRGIDAVLTEPRAEEFRRAMVVTLTDGGSVVEHALDTSAGERRWLTWSLSKQHDGVLHAVVVDVTRARAGAAWRTVSSIAAELTGAASSLAHARRVLTQTVRNELDGSAVLVAEGDDVQTALVARARAEDRGLVDCDPAGTRADVCALALPLAWDGATVVLHLTTALRLDLWLEDIHLTALRRSLERAVRDVARRERAGARAARERRLTEQLARELHQPMRLLDRTLRTARRIEQSEQREYLLARATRLTERLTRLTRLVQVTEEDDHEPAPTTVVLAEVVRRAAEAAGVETALDTILDDVQVVADPELLSRALEVLLRAVATDGAPLLDVRSRPDGGTALHVHRGPRDPANEADADLTPVGVLLAGGLVTPWGGVIEACLEGGGTGACRGVGVELALPGVSHMDPA